MLLVILVVNWQVLNRHHERDAMNRMMQADDVPPSLALVTFAVGPMRGLIADVLWWRAVQMQDRGNFFESIQLAEWITKLQPTFATVWAYHGWNMSSNIVNEVEDPDERWKWVLQGIELLRDEGLRYNPGNEIIRRELAGIFRNRIGRSLDSHHQHYKQQWVRLVIPFIQDGNRAELEGLASAARTRRELVARPGVNDLVESAQRFGVNLLTFEGYYQRDGWTDELWQQVSSEAGAAAMREIRLYHSVQGVTTKLGMDPERMLLIDEHYGPLDWRLWQAQTIYWAAADGLPGYEGVPYGSGAMENTFIQQAMYSSFREGRLVFLKDDQMLLTNNLEIMPKVDVFLHEVVHGYEEKGLEPPAGPVALFKSFHETAAVIFYSYQEEHLAHEMYETYVEEFMSPEERQRTTFESFIASRAELMLRERNQDSAGLVISSLYQAYTWLALGDGWKAQAFERFAELLHRRHQQRYEEQPEQQLQPLGAYRQVALDMALDPERSTLPVPVQGVLRRLRGEQPVLSIQTQGERPAFDWAETIHDRKHDH